MLRQPHHRTPIATATLDSTLGRNFLMFRTAGLHRQESWLPFLLATAALGLALYYLRTRHPPPSSASNPSQVDQEPCRAPDPFYKLNAMDPEERAYHERFMREAIAMVNHFPSPTPNRSPVLTHRPIRPSLHSRATRRQSAASSSKTARSLVAA